MTLGVLTLLWSLIAQGCKRIAHLTGPHAINIYQERLRGYQEALLDNGIPLDEGLILRSNMQLEDGRESVRALLKNGIGR